MKTLFKVSLSLLALAPLVALAQPARQAPARQAPAQVGDVNITNGEGGTSTYLPDQGITHMTKDVVITQRAEDITMFAQDATYNEQTNLANASGRLRIETRDSTITGQKLFANFNTRTATITGNVVINSHGAQDGIAAGLRGQLRQKPVKVLCERVDWNYQGDIRQATATGNIRIFQGVNRGTCDSIVFDEVRNIIELRGNVRFTDDKNRVLRGDNITFYVDENRIASNTRIRVFMPANDTPRPTPSGVVRFAPAPTLPPDVLNVEAAPPLPTPRATTTVTPVEDEPVPTPRPDNLTTTPAPSTDK